jgi:hypothetical protein
VKYLSHEIIQFLIIYNTLYTYLHIYIAKFTPHLLAKVVVEVTDPFAWVVVVTFPGQLLTELVVGFVVTLTGRSPAIADVAAVPVKSTIGSGIV